MDWEEINIYTTSDGVEAVTGALIELGITGFVIKDERDLEEFLADKTANWDYIDDDLMQLRGCETTVTVYLPQNAEGAELFAAVRSKLALMREQDTEGMLGRLEISTDDICEEDWANNWKKYFKPIAIGDRLLIKPSWEKAAADESRRILEIDPESSFGTGQHDTTRLCLELIEKYLVGGERVLDLGCGSGILSIGALLLGAKSAVAVDIDANSVKIAAQNADKNAISGDRYTAICGDVISDQSLVARIGGGYDLIFANIVADVLIAMSGIFDSFLKDGGKLVLSGIIDDRLDEVMTKIKSCGFTLIDSRSGGEWNAACFVKNQ